MIYHYTHRAAGRSILSDGAIRPSPVVVYSTPFGSFDGPGRELAPAVWLTVCDRPSATVVTSLLVAGCPVAEPGQLWRFGVRDCRAWYDLRSWAESHGYAAGTFSWMVATARLAGEDWRDWRLTGEPVPAAEWLAVESWHDDRWVADRA